MLKNRLRMMVGILILLVFGLGIFQYVRQTAGNPLVGPALASGLKVILFLALILGVAYLLDRRVNRRQR